MTVAAKPAHPRRADLTPLYTLLSDGRWWRLFEVTAALGIARRRAASRLAYAVAEGGVEKSKKGFRLVEARPAIRRADPLRGAPKGPDGRVVPIRETRPVLSLADLQTGVLPHRPRHPWWPGVSTRCAECGGKLVLEPPIGRVPGSLLCLNAGHEAAEVRP